jgi:hypothetical protein
MSHVIPPSHKGQTSNAYKILIGNLKGTDHFEGLGVDGRIISDLKNKETEYGGADWILLAYGRVQGGLLQTW